jgi:hypothetical protein
MQHKRRRQEEENEDEASKQKKKAQNETLTFLKNNIGKNDESEIERARRMEEKDANGYESDEDDNYVVVDSDDEWAEMSEDVRRATFQAYYKKEKVRLKALADGENPLKAVVSDDCDDDEPGVNWEAG